MKLSYRACLRPTPTQVQSLLQHAGNARYAYNWGLSQHKATYSKWVSLGKPKKWDGWLNAISLHRDLNKLKKLPVDQGGVPWMYEASKCSPQEALRDLDKAFRGFLTGKAKYPRFKSRNRGIGGFRLTGTIKVTKTHVQLPTLGKIRLMPHERGYLPEGTYGQATVREHAGRWFVTILGADRVEASPNEKPAVGIDLGVAVLATLSDGATYANPKALTRHQRKLKRLQRSLARKKKGSANRLKAKQKVSKAHARVRHLRQDNLHKVTTDLAKNHGKVVLEDLNVKGMTKGGKGKRGLNRAMSDASFGEFRRLLEYKGKMYGSQVVTVPPHYTSQMCNVCGHIERGNRASQAVFACLACGHEANADLNAAKNILDAASTTESLNACGEGLRPDLTFGSVKAPSLKQEPSIREGSLPVRAAASSLPC